MAALAGCRKNGVQEDTAIVDNFSTEVLAQLRLEAVMSPGLDCRALASDAKGHVVRHHAQRENEGCCNGIAMFCQDGAWR